MYEDSFFGCNARSTSIALLSSKEKTSILNKNQKKLCAQSDAIPQDLCYRLLGGFLRFVITMESLLDL